MTTSTQTPPPGSGAAADTNNGSAAGEGSGNQRDTKLRCICGSEDYVCLFDGYFERWTTPNYKFSLHQCRKCKLVRTLPVPGAELYTEEGVCTWVDEKGEYIVRDKPWMKVQALDIQRLINARPALVGKPVLEIGCNGGEMLQELVKLGITNVSGYDIDPVAIKYGQGQGRKVAVRDVTAEGIEGQYGFIAMIHTLEHIEAVPPLIKAVDDALIPGGLLYIRVPNYAGWIARLMKHNWEFLVPPHHVWQWTPETLRYHVERGTSLRHVETICRTHLEPDTQGVKALLKKAVKSAAALCNQSDELVAVYEKK